MDADNFNRLIVTPKPSPEESQIGYLIRISEANGFCTPRSILSLSVLKKLNEGLGGLVDILPGILSELSGHSLDSINALPWSKWPDKRMTLGKKLANKELFSYVHFKHSRICPECIKQNGFAKYAWDAKLMVACAHHRKRLVQECRHCHKRITWARPGLLSCSCGMVISQSRETISEKLSEFLMIIEASLAGASIADSKFGYPVEGFAGLLSIELLRLLNAVGKSCLESFDSIHPTVEQMEALAQLFTEWPVNFKARLLAMNEANKDVYLSKDRFRTRFPTLYHIFSKRGGRAHLLGFFRAPMQELEANYWRASASVDTGTDEVRTKGSKLSERLNIPPETATRFIEEIRLGKKFFRDELGKYYVLSRAGVPSECSPEEIRIDGAASLLGLTPSVVLALNIPGVFQYQGRGRPRFVSNDALHRLQSKVLALGVPLIDDLPDGCSRLKAMPHGFTAPKYLAWLIGESLAGRMPIIGRLSKDFFDFVVPSDALVLALRRYKDDPGELVTPVMACKLLNCSPSVLPTLINTGQLTVFQLDKVSLVEYKSLSRFLEQWGSAHAFAEKYGTTSPVVGKIVEAWQLEHLYVPFYGRNGKQLFICREVWKKLGRLFAKHGRRHSRCEYHRPRNVPHSWKVGWLWRLRQESRGKVFLRKVSANRDRSLAT